MKILDRVLFVAFGALAVVCGYLGFAIHDAGRWASLENDVFIMIGFLSVGFGIFWPGTALQRWIRQRARRR
jgi:uncharacterized membrane protein YbaN (DUF454 family)